MAIIHLEGFDDSHAARRMSLSSAGIGSSYGYTGNGIRLGDTTDYYMNVTTPSGTTPFSIGFHCKIVSGGSAYLVRFEDAIQSALYIYFDATGKRVGFLGQNSSFSPLYSANGSVDYGEWHFIELYMLGNTGSAGSYHFRLDGATVGQETGTADFGYIPDGLARFGTNLNVDDYYVDNLYVTDATGGVNTGLLGEIDIKTVFPNGNGNYSGLTGSDGNSTDNYQLVDEDPPITTDYVGSGTEGDKDTYAFEDITGDPDIVGAMLTTYDAKNDVGDKFVRHVARVSSTDYNSSSFGLSTSFVIHETVYDENPNTSTAWTQTTFNGAEFGQEVRDS